MLPQLAGGEQSAAHRLHRIVLTLPNRARIAPGRILVGFTVDDG